MMWDTISGGGIEMLLVRATVLIAIAWIAAAALAHAGASAAMRYLAWLLGLVALLAFPIVTATMPRLDLPILAAPIASAVPAAEIAQASPLGWILGIAYLLVAALLASRLVIARRLLRKAWNAASPSDDGGWHRTLEEACRELGLHRPPGLRFSPEPVMPMTWGTLAPKVLLPDTAHGWPAEQRRQVLLHELAHVARRDSLGRTLAAIACALYWFHPAVWLAAWRLRIEQEHAADDRVIAAGTLPRVYADNLLGLASAPQRALPAHAAAMARTSQLESRLVAIVGRRSRRRSGVFFSAGSGAFAAAATWAVATAVPVSAVPTASIDVAAAQGPMTEAPAPPEPPTMSTAPSVPTSAPVPRHRAAAAISQTGRGAPRHASRRIAPRAPPTPVPPVRPVEPPAPLAPVAAVPAVPPLAAIPAVPPLPPPPSPPDEAHPPL